MIDARGGFKRVTAELLKRIEVSFEGEPYITWDQQTESLTYGQEFVAQSGFSCMVDILLKLRRLEAIISEVPLVLRYDMKYGASKMLVLRTAIDTLQLLISRRLGIG